jgi:hypothetical protein
MTLRRIPAPMLYRRNTPARWMRALLCKVDEAAASLCRNQWQNGLAPSLQPACIRAARGRAGVDAGRAPAGWLAQPRTPCP